MSNRQVWSMVQEKKLKLFATLLHNLLHLKKVQTTATTDQQKIVLTHPIMVVFVSRTTAVASCHSWLPRGRLAHSLALWSSCSDHGWVHGWSSCCCCCCWKRPQVLWCIRIVRTGRPEFHSTDHYQSGREVWLLFMPSWTRLASRRGQLQCAGAVNRTQVSMQLYMSLPTSDFTLTLVCIYKRVAYAYEDFLNHHSKSI